MVGIAPGHSGNVIVCPRAKVSVIPQGLSLTSAAALVGRLAFISSVISKALPPSGRKAILHAGDCSAAAFTTYSYLKATGFDILVTISANDSRGARELISLTSTHRSNDYRSWVAAARQDTPKGFDLAVNFDTDPSVATETTHTLAAGGTFVQVGGDLPTRLRRGQRYISVDWAALADDEYLLRTLEDVPPEIRDSFLSSVESLDLGQLSVAHEKALSNAPNEVVLLDLETIDHELSILRPGTISGTPTFDPQASYVLIGGVGGLGIALANFMVDRGARHIVLTSRSGTKASCAYSEHQRLLLTWCLYQTFEDIDFTREKRMVHYLRNLPGVTVDIAAVDCLDAEGTKKLFANLEHPAAGVFFLPARLNDQMFINLKTEEDWKVGELQLVRFSVENMIITSFKVYDVKAKGLQILLDAVDPASLDFLVLTSTTSIISGNSGRLHIQVYRNSTLKWIYQVKRTMWLHSIS